MASLVNANLPSEDEEDDDYDPSMDPTGEKEPGQQGKAAGRKRGRGIGGADAAEAADGEDDAEPAGRAKHQQAVVDDDILTPAQAAKKARISAMFEQLHESSTGSANKLSRNTISLASLCSNTNPKKKRNTDLLWMRNLGIAPGSANKAKQQRGSDAANPPTDLTTPQPAATAAAAGEQTAAEPQAAAAAAAAGGTDASAPADASMQSPAAAAAAADTQQQQPQQQDGIPPSSNNNSGNNSIRAAAAAALAAAREAATGGVSKSYNKVTVTETRRFAGKDIEVTVQVEADSKAAKKAAERSAAAASGLDAFLTQIEGKKKVSVLDKSKMDWQDFKSTDVEVQEELEAHRRSDKQYLDKQDFLKRAELREYEIERDKRLASDVRLRGRL